MELVKDVGGRPQKSLSEQQVQEVKTLAGVLSKQQLAAYFGMCENTLNEICKRQPEVFDAYRRGRAETTVQVVSALMDAIQRGDMRAIQFWLKTQAGWSEKHQLEIAKAEQGDNIEDRHWTFEVMGEKPERLPPREINFVRTGMNADGTKYQFSTDEAGNPIIIDHDGTVYPDDKG